MDYIIENHNGEWLSSNNSVKFEYWCGLSSRDVIRHSKVIGLLKINFIRLIYKIQKTPERLYLKTYHSILEELQEE